MILHPEFPSSLALHHLTTTEISTEFKIVKRDFDLEVYKAKRDLQEDVINKNKGLAHYQFVNREEADKLRGFLVAPPPSNDEIEILGIEVRVSDRKQDE
jgi:hypothetical protein